MTLFLNQDGHLKHSKIVTELTPLSLRLNNQYLTHNHIIISGHKHSNICDANYLIKLTHTGKLVTEFGIEGAAEYNNPDEDQIFIGEFSNGQFLSATIDHNIIDIFVMDKAGNYITDYGYDGYINLSTSLRNVKSAVINEDRIYIVHDKSLKNSFTYLTKLRLDKVSNAVIPELKTENSITLYPNPASTHTNLLYTGPMLSDVILHIHNASGQLLQEKEIELLSRETELHINTSNFGTGQYLISLQDRNNKVITKSFFIKN